MNNCNNILDYFPSLEMKRKIEDIVYVIDDLSKKPPVTGFHYSFYVPGWIGVFQMMKTEKRMSRFASKQFYRGMNYYKFAEWIVDKSEEVASLQKRTASEDTETVKLQNEAIIRVFIVLTSLWLNHFPEISKHCNIKDEGNTFISLARFVFNGLEKNLNELGYSDNSQQLQGYIKGFEEETKDFSYKFLGFVINVIILALFFSLLSTIFG